MTTNSNLLSQRDSRLRQDSNGALLDSQTKEIFKDSDRMQLDKQLKFKSTKSPDGKYRVSLSHKKKSSMRIKGAVEDEFEKQMDNIIKDVEF